MVLSKTGRQMRIVWMYGWMDGCMHGRKEIGRTRKK